MNALEKLNKQAEKDQERIDRLNAKMAEAEATIMRDPDNTNAALEAAAASMQAQAAQRALENTQREIEAEKQRVYEPSSLRHDHYRAQDLLQFCDRLGFQCISRR